MHLTVKPAKSFIKLCAWSLPAWPGSCGSLVATLPYFALSAMQVCFIISLTSDELNRRLITSATMYRPFLLFPISTPAVYAGSPFSSSDVAARSQPLAHLITSGGISSSIFTFTRLNIKPAAALIFQLPCSSRSLCTRAIACRLAKYPGSFFIRILLSCSVLAMNVTLLGIVSACSGLTTFSIAPCTASSLLSNKVTTSFSRTIQRITPDRSGIG